MTALEMEFDGVLAVWLGPEETNYSDGVWICAECEEPLAFGHADDCGALARALARVGESDDEQ